jgi:hypothetical protein
MTNQATCEHPKSRRRVIVAGRTLYMEECECCGKPFVGRDNDE